MNQEKITGGKVDIEIEIHIIEFKFFEFIPTNHIYFRKISLRITEKI